MLKLSIMASQITNLTDARYFAAWEVEWLGFNLDAGSENAVSPQQISAIKAWVEGPKIVGAFGLQTPEDIKAVADYLELDAIQLGMFADTEVVKKEVGLPILKEVVIENEDLAGVEELMNAQASWVEIFILDFTKADIKWPDLSPEIRSLLKKLCGKYAILFNLHLSLDEVSDFMEQVNPKGLLLIGDEEEKVGYKSFEELDDLLESIRGEE